MRKSAVQRAILDLPLTSPIRTVMMPPVEADCSNWLSLLSAALPGNYRVTVFGTLDTVTNGDRRKKIYCADLS